MKKTKVLVPAMGLLLLSTAASVTGTVAWFASQATVTATGMSVTVKSDTAFLLIKAGAAADAAAVRSGGAASANASTASRQLLPVAHEAAANSIATAEATTGEGASATMTNWYYYYSKDPAHSDGGTAGLSEKYNVTASAFNNYVLANEFNLTLAEGSSPMNTLRVNHCTITPTTDKPEAVKVLVATGTAAEEFSGTGGDGSTTLQAALTDATVMQVKVYIYWDGADSDIYTNNIDNLLSTSVEITFTGLVG